MTDPRDNKPASTISEEAAEWFVRLKDGDVAAATRTQYLQWLKRSPSHIAEVLRVCRVYGVLRDTNLDLETPLRAVDASNVIDWPGREPESSSAPSARRLHVRRIAAAIAVCTFAALLALIATQAGWLARDIETQASEWRVVELGDRTIARLGPRTKLRLRFDDDVRLVELSHGEAVFQVAKDPKRPFMVNAGSAVVRAVGTEFGVSRIGEEVIVTVAEGQVAVAQGGRSTDLQRSVDEDISVALRADQQIRFTLSSASAVEEVSAASELAWSRRRLIFDDETIADAVREFNRRNRMQIVVDDAAIAGRRACCNFDADDPQSFAESLAAEPDIALVRDEPGVLRLIAEAAPAGSQAAPGDAI